jgi:hypothetical protein
MSYIRDNVGIIDIDELAQQASDMLVARVDDSCTKDLVFNHISSHSQDHRIVTAMLLRDLRPILQKLHASAVSYDEEGHVVVHKTHMHLYLKTIEVTCSLTGKLDK